jgi:hypothetical protein
MVKSRETMHSRIQLGLQVEGAGMRLHIGSIILAFLFFFSALPPGVRAEEKQVITVGYIPLLAQLPLVVSYDNDRLNYSNVEVRLVKYQ